MATQESKINKLLICFQSGCTSTYSSNFYCKYRMNIFTHKYYQTNFLNKRENNILTNLLILYIKREVTQKKRERSCKVLRNNYSCFYFVYILLILNRYCINISCINLVLNLNYFLLFFFFLNLIISYLNYKKTLFLF